MFRRGHKKHGVNFPCGSCTASKHDCHTRYGACSIRDLAWLARTHETYLDELSSHMVEIKLPDIATRDSLVAHLFTRKAAPWGRCFGKYRPGQSPFPLAYGDRLVAPTNALTYITDLETLEAPSSVFVFRQRVDSQTTANSVLFNVPGVFSNGIEHFTTNRLPEDVLHNGP